PVRSLGKQGHSPQWLQGVIVLHVGYRRRPGCIEVKTGQVNLIVRRSQGRQKIANKGAKTQVLAVRRKTGGSQQGASPAPWQSRKGADLPTFPIIKTEISTTHRIGIGHTVAQISDS